MVQHVRHSFRMVDPHQLLFHLTLMANKTVCRQLEQTAVQVGIDIAEDVDPKVAEQGRDHLVVRIRVLHRDGPLAGGDGRCHRHLPVFLDVVVMSRAPPHVGQRQTEDQCADPVQPQQGHGAIDTRHFVPECVERRVDDLKQTGA